MRLARSFGQSTKLILLTILAVVIHGYHLGVDDGAIYVPGIKKFFDPQLYPFGAEFFQHHSRMSIFAPTVALAARVLHLPIDVAVFLAFILCTFFLLLTGWRLACLCFLTARARWAAVSLLAAILTVPIAGTALVISDPYLTARSLSTPLTMLAIEFFLRGKKGVAFFLIFLTALVHPQMAVFGVGFMIFDALSEHWSSKNPAHATSAAAVFMPSPSHWFQGFNFQPVHGTYREVLYSRTFFFASLWQWYEWIGVVLPLAILHALSRLQPRNASPMFQRICRALVPFGIFSTIVFLVLSSSRYLANFTRLQPMRSFHVIYVLFCILLGGLLGEYILKNRVWLWLAVFVPLSIGMFAVNRVTYPHSPHIEWPDRANPNPWVSAFLWVRDNTPKDAVFALDPRYLAIPEEDQHGFRAIAERSVLADAVKDSGAVSLFPQLTSDWEAQQQAVAGWNHFQTADFIRLAHQYPVTWVILQGPIPSGFNCPYQNNTVTVCCIPLDATTHSAGSRP